MSLWGDLISLFEFPWVQATRDWILLNDSSFSIQYSWKFCKSAIKFIKFLELWIINGLLPFNWILLKIDYWCESCIHNAWIKAVATQMPKSWPVITGSVACLTLNLRANTNITPYMKKSKFLTMINSKNEIIDTLRMNWQKESNCCDLQLTKTCFFYLPSSKNYVQVPKYESHKILYKFTVLQKINAFFLFQLWVEWSLFSNE